MVNNDMIAVFKNIYFEKQRNDKKEKDFMLRNLLRWRKT